MFGSTGFIHTPAPSKAEGKIKVWSYCRSLAPDDKGHTFRVTRLNADGTADLQYADDTSGSLEGYVTRPAAVLRRMTDPRNQKPAIEGMPAVRPVCAWCGVKLRPFLKEERHTPVNDSRAWRIVRRVFVRWDAYEDVFHSAGCATKFAGAAYRGGFRRVKK